MLADDAELLRLDASARGRAIADLVGAGSVAFVGRVTTAAPAVGTFMEVVPRLVTGTEGEGNAGVRTDLDAATPRLVYLVGPGVPATGDDVLCRLVDYRWAAHKRGATSPPPPPTTVPVACAGHATETAPATIYLSVPAAGFPLGSQYCGDANYHQISEATVGACCFRGADPSAAFVYGSAPSECASAFVAGYRAWFDPTPFTGPRNLGSGCFNETYDQKFYQYISYNCTSGRFQAGVVSYSESGGVGTWTAFTPSMPCGSVWTMGGSNTWSPFLATCPNTSGSGVATISG